MRGSRLGRLIHHPDHRGSPGKEEANYQDCSDDEKDSIQEALVVEGDARLLNLGSTLVRY